VLGSFTALVRRRDATLRRAHWPGREHDMDDRLRLDDYPQLALLAWNRAVREISGEEAFALYERNWRFVDQESLTPREAALIDRLTRRYGHGVLNV
jgi:hypothetical protein